MYVYTIHTYRCITLYMSKICNYCSATFPEGGGGVVVIVGAANVVRQLLLKRSLACGEYAAARRERQHSLFAAKCASSCTHTHTHTRTHFAYTSTLLHMHIHIYIQMYIQRCQLVCIITSVYLYTYTRVHIYFLPVQSNPVYCLYFPRGAPSLLNRSLWQTAQAHCFLHAYTNTHSCVINMFVCIYVNIHMYKC